MICMVTYRPVWPAASAPAHIVIHVFFCVFADVTQIKITHSLCKYVNTSATFQMFAFEVAAQDQMYLVSSETFCFLKNKCIFQKCIFAFASLFFLVVLKMWLSMSDKEDSAEAKWTPGVLSHCWSTDFSIKFPSFLIIPANLLIFSIQLTFERLSIQILDPDIWESLRDIFAHFFIINESEGRYFYLEFRWQILFLMRGNNKSENKKVLNLQVSVLMRHSFQHMCLKQCGFCPSSAFLQLQNWMFYCVINNWHMWVSFVPSESSVF